MKQDFPKKSGRRVSLRMIASAAKVSVMTVSYALRGSSEVSPGECRRIQKIAEVMRYRPDPLLSHLMLHLRSGRNVRSSSNLAVVADLKGGFVERQIAGAEARAAKLGYHLDRIDPRIFEKNPSGFTRTLLARGISGVLLAGRSVPADCTTLLDWSNFAAVAMSYSVILPRMHRVVTHHFDNAVRTFDLMAGRGMRRIALAMTPDMELRANHSYVAAFSHSARNHGLEQIPTLLLHRDAKAAIIAWFKRYKPEAVVIANAGTFPNLVIPIMGEAACRNVAVATLDTEAEYPIAGIDQIYETIGWHAVDAVVAQIHRNERGLPADPVVAMVEGRWDERGGLYPLARPIRPPGKSAGGRPSRPDLV